MKKVPSVRMPDPKAGVIRSEHPRDVGVRGLVESHNWILRDGHVKLRDGIVPVAVPAMTLITPGASWSDEGGNVWSASLSTEPQSVWMDGVKGTNDLTPDAEYDWYWSSSTLYIYSTTDPDTTYTDPGVQWASGTGGSSITGLISHDYQGQDDSGNQDVIRDQLIAITDSDIVCYNNDLTVHRSAVTTNVDWAWQGALGQNPIDANDPWHISEKISFDWSNINWSVIEGLHGGTVYGFVIALRFGYYLPSGITLYTYTFDDTVTKGSAQYQYDPFTGQVPAWNKPGTDSNLIYSGEYQSGYPWEILDEPSGSSTGIYVVFSDTWASWYDELNASGGNPASSDVAFYWVVYQSADNGLPGGQAIVDLDRTVRPVSRTWDYEQTTHVLVAAKDKYILDIDADSLGAVPDPTVSVAGDAGVSPRSRCIGQASQRIVAGNVSYFDCETTFTDNMGAENLNQTGTQGSGAGGPHWHDVVDKFATFPDACVYSGTVLTGGHTYWYPGDIIRLADTAGEIVAIQEMGTQQVAVYKTDSIYTLTAQSGVAPFAPSLRASGIQGPVGPRAVVAISDQTHLYLGRDGGVYMFTGGPPQSLGDQFREWIGREIDPQTYADDSFMLFDPEHNEVHLYYPVKGSAGVVRKGLVIDVSKQPFTAWPVLWPKQIYNAAEDTAEDINFLCATMHWEGNQDVATSDITIPAAEAQSSPVTKYQELYFGTENKPLTTPRTTIDAGRIFKAAEDIGNDHGVAIEASMESGISDFGDPDNQKVILEMELLFNNIANISGGTQAHVDVTIYGGDSNDSLTQLWQKNDISISSGQITVHPRVRARYFSVKVVATAPIEAYDKDGGPDWTQSFGVLKTWGALVRYKVSGVRQN